MMIRSRQVPPLLKRICGDGIRTASIITSEGELLGSSQCDDVADKAALVADITTDYARLGQELQQRQLYYLEMEMSEGLIGVASAGSECFVVAFADKSAAPGILKARLTACASHVQEAFSPLVAS